MNYTNLKQQFSEIYSLLELEKSIFSKLNGLDKLRYREVIHKTMVIELYTFWENFVKELIYDTYLTHKKMIVDEEFIKKYFKNINENNYLRNKFLENISEDKITITIDTLCHSNNLDEKVLRDLFKRINFDTNDLDKHLKSADLIKTSLISLQDSSIKKIEKNTQFEIRVDDVQSDNGRHLRGIYDYIHTLVQLRNNVSHNFKVDEIYSIEDFEILSGFLYEVSFSILEFTKSQSIKKMISFHPTETKILRQVYPRKIFRRTKDGFCIVGINNFGNKIIEKDSVLYFYSSSLDIYQMAVVLEIKKNDDFVKEGLPYEEMGLKLKTNMNLNRKDSFNLYHCNEVTSEYSYVLTI